MIKPKGETMCPLFKLIIVSVYLVCSVHCQSTNAINDLDDNSLCSTRYAKFHTNHTACVKPNRYCKINKKSVTRDEQKLILDVHNHYRNLIASGKETKLGFPSASNMVALEWDNELAYVAQKHADQCQFQHDCYDCRKTEKYDVVGQNLYIYRTTRTSVATQWRFVIKEWYDEIKIAPSVVAKSFNLFNLNIGHFTQVAWAETTKVGCGFSTYDNFDSGKDNAIFKTVQLYTCNYAPGGNYLNEKMYSSGKPASQCPTKYVKSSKFDALCELARGKSKKKKNKSKNKKKRTRSTRKPTITTRQASSFSSFSEPSSIFSSFPSKFPSFFSTGFSKRSSTDTTTTTTTTSTTPAPKPQTTVAEVITTTALTSKPVTIEATLTSKPVTITTTTRKPKPQVSTTSRPFFSNWSDWLNKWKSTSTTPSGENIITTTTTTTTKAPKYPWLLSFRNFTFDTSKTRSIPKRYLRIEMSHNGTVHQNIRTII